VGRPRRRPASDREGSPAVRDARRIPGRAGFQPDAILSSPRIRALETARLVAAALGVRVDVVDALGEQLDLESLDRLLRSAGDPRRPVLVGHDPDFSMLAAELVGVADLPIRKATLVRIDVVRPLQPDRASCAGCCHRTS